MVVLAAGLALYVLAMRRAQAHPRRRLFFLAGWLVLTAALISPLCPLSVSLFSARVGQHMILSLVAAPLLVLGRPIETARAAWPTLFPRAWAQGPSFASTAAAATLAFTLAVWFWHAPGPYAATFTSTVTYWLMHVTVVGAALMLWSVLLDDRSGRALAALAGGAASTLQMTFLGALITLTPRLLYAPHVLSPYAWGMTQAGDQQLGGLIMWVPGCTIFLGVTLYALARMMVDRPEPAIPA